MWEKSWRLEEALWLDGEILLAMSRKFGMVGVSRGVLVSLDRIRSR